MAKRERDPSREQHWRAVMADWQASGLTVREFCTRRQFAEPSFYYWRRELRTREGKRAPTSAPVFVPVTVRPATTVEVRCPSGHVVSLSNTDLDTLRHLFAARAEEPPC